MYNSIKRNTLKGTLLACASLFGVFFTSCQNNDNDIWDKDPIVRLEQAKTELKNTLVSSQNGWIVTFSPDGNKYLGGFNVWMKFEDDLDMLIKTDLYMNQLEAEKTEFKFTLLETMTLNFPYGNKLHEFTSLSPNDLRTDFEFVFNAYVDENTIEFIGKMTKQKIYFTKATAEEANFNFQDQWNTYAQLKTMKTITLVQAGVSSNFVYSPLLEDDDWRACQMMRGTNTVDILTFTASKDGSSVTLGKPYLFSDGSTVSKLDKSGNTFVGVSETGEAMIIK